MYGYIYMTTNKVTDSLYVGKHKAPKYDPSYLGSGACICKEVGQYGPSAFDNDILAIADSRDELNKLEKEWIAKIHGAFPDKCINFAAGGDGGNVYAYAPPEMMEKFIKRMTEINRQRCSSSEFKANQARNMQLRYQDATARELQSKVVREAWSDTKLREQQSERLKSYYSTHKKDQSYLHKPCIFALNGMVRHFDSVKELREFLTDEYGYTPDRRTFHKLMEDGAMGIPYKPFHKNKFAQLAGMRICYDPN